MRRLSRLFIIAVAAILLPTALPSAARADECSLADAPKPLLTVTPGDGTIQLQWGLPGGSDPKWAPLQWYANAETAVETGYNTPNSHDLVLNADATGTRFTVLNGIRLGAYVYYLPSCAPSQATNRFLQFATGSSAEFIANPPVAFRRFAGADAALTGGRVTYSVEVWGSSPGPYQYAWDLDGSGPFEVKGKAVQSTSFDSPGKKVVRVRATAANGQSAVHRFQTEVYLAPPNENVGVSIDEGRPYTNEKAVALSLSWPEYATSARVSNDGGFAQARTYSLGEPIPWVLDDSIKSIATKVVYVRFAGPGADTTKTFTDDIVLDLTPPVVKEATATAPSVSAAAVQRKLGYRLKVRAADKLTGVAQMRVNTRKSIRGADAVRYRGRVSVTLPKARRLFVQVSDGAGNWTTWKKVKVR